MAFKLGTFMFYIRIKQLLVFIAIAFENGWLINYISKRRLGLSGNMQSIEWIVSQQFSAEKRQQKHVY
jgi:hypothetical protein